MKAKKKILIIDDEPDYVAVLQEHLEREGFEVAAAYDGIEGLRKVEAVSPDAIVLDVMMPDKDGYEVCAELKADKRFAAIPVIMLTAVASHVPSTRYSHYEGMTMEAEDYIPKPASWEQILASLRRVLHL